MRSRPGWIRASITWRIASTRSPPASTPLSTATRADAPHRRASCDLPGWPSAPAELETLQRALGRLEPAIWRFDPERRLVAAGAFVAGPVGHVGTGAAGDPQWAGAVALAVGESWPLGSVAIHGRAGGPYTPGLLALREGVLLERAIRSLRVSPDIVLVNGTGRDHPRRAGIALHLGAMLDVPTVGVTDRPLVAAPVEPTVERGSMAPLVLDGEVVGAALRTRRGARPVLVHAAWRTDATIAVDVVRHFTRRYRTPEPIRLARRSAREARAG